MYKDRGWKREWGKWGIGISDQKIRVAAKLKEKIYVRVGKYPELYCITPGQARKYGFANIQSRAVIIVIPVSKFSRIKDGV